MRILLTCVWVLGAVSKGVQYDYCSLGHSDDVRAEVEDYFVESFAAFDIQLSQSCPFYQLDQTIYQYNLGAYHSKLKSAQGKTECPLCQKSFKSDEYFEYHLHTRHAHPLDSQTCLADFCDIFPCHAMKP